MSIRKDFIERMIEQLVAALARILKARQEQRYDDALQHIGEAARSMLGMEYRVLTLADAASTARLLGEPGRVRVLAKLVRQEAEVRREQGDALGAGDRFRLSLELYLEARELGLRLDGEDTRDVTELREAVGEVALSERYQRLLARA
jgi:hypothetical protein